MKPAHFALLLVLATACSKTEQPKLKPQTPAEICDAAKAAGLIEKCTANPQSPASRDTAIMFAGESAFAVSLQTTATEAELEKLQLSNAETDPP